MAPLQRLFDFFDLERFDDVAFFELGEALEADTALEAFFDVLGVVLEAFQTADLALPERGAVAQEASSARAFDDTFDDHATGNRAGFAGLEDLANLGFA